MYLTRQTSRHFDPAQVLRPERRGAVAWGQFNEHFPELVHGDWRRVNDGQQGSSRGLRLLRLVLAWRTHRRDAFLDLERKAKVLWRFARCLPPHPRIVFFGAEAGWEALLLHALCGGGGRVVLIDADPAAHRRFLAAPRETVIRAPRGFPGDELVLARDPTRLEYLQADFFDVELPSAFDVGIDWGLLGHFPDDEKPALLERFRRFLVPGGVQISSVPRDGATRRLFHRAFRDELGFGYGELLSPREHVARLAAGGFEVLDKVAMATRSVCLARPR